MGIFRTARSTAPARRDAAPPELEVGRLQDLAVRELREQLGRKGVATNRNGRRVELCGTGVTCDLRLREFSTLGLVLEYRLVHRLDARPIVQHLVWFGEDHEQSVVQLVRVLIRGVLAPLLAAYDVHLPDVEVGVLHGVCAADGRTGGWKVFVGDPIVIGTSGDAVRTVDRSIRRTDALLRPMRDGISQLMSHRDEAGRPAFHWWKVLVGRSSSGKLWGDAWFDERACEDTFRRVASLPLPHCRLMLLRQFGVMRPDPSPDASLGEPGLPPVQGAAN